MQVEQHLRGGLSAKYDLECGQSGKCRPWNQDHCLASGCRKWTRDRLHYQNHCPTDLRGRSSLSMHAKTQYIIGITQIPSHAFAKMFAKDGGLPCGPYKWICRTFCVPLIIKVQKQRRRFIVWYLTRRHSLDFTVTSWLQDAFIHKPSQLPGEHTARRPFPAHRTFQTHKPLLSYQRYPLDLLLGRESARVSKVPCLGAQRPSIFSAAGNRTDNLSRLYVAHATTEPRRPAQKCGWFYSIILECGTFYCVPLIITVRLILPYI